MAIIDDQETLAIFLEDSLEHLSGIENDLLAIEEGGENVDVDLINKVFRAIHSIKGGAGFLGLDVIKELAHVMENILNMMRNLELAPNAVIISTLLSAADVLMGMINDPVASNEMDISEQLAALQGCITASLPEEDKEAVDTMVPVTLPDGREMFRISAFDLEQAGKGGKQIYILTFNLISDIDAKGKTPLDVIHELQQTGMLIESKVDVTVVGPLTQSGELPRVPFVALYASLLEPEMVVSLFDLDTSQVQLASAGTTPEASAPAAASEANSVDSSVAADTMPEAAPQAAPLTPSEPASATQLTPSEPQPTTPAPQPKPVASPPVTAKQDKVEASKAPQTSKSPVVEGSLRVNVKVLDTLMTLAGELVLTRNQLVQSVTSGNTQAIDATTQRVDLVTSELQEAIMSTRMQQVGNVFNKFQRVVRDMARDLGKEVTLEITGEEVELDKTIIEGIGDPLTHLVRNAMDHGIEQPEVRRQAGKSTNATLKLSARHEAGKVIIEVNDDGGGIHPQRIKDKALAQGLYDQAQLDAMSDQDVVKLIFLPGFSTAKEVTDISGRGVGMDVVHTNLTKLGGTIDVDSEVGRGSTFCIKLPLTLAIIPSQLISVQDERYAIPQVNLVELVRVPASQLRERIEHIGAALVMRLRGELLPLIHLHDVLGIERTEGAGHATATAVLDGGKSVNIVVVVAGNLHYGLIVDQLLDSEEIVVKPLGQHLQESRIYAGATIQGDGRVALILDVVGVSAMMQLAKVGDTAREGALKRPLGQHKGTDAQSLLLIKNAPEEQFAIPLALVSRIERVHKRDIETAGGRRNIKYRGGNLVLVCIEDAVNVGPCADQEDLAAVVFSVGGREVGLLVSQIVEVIETDATIDAATFRQPGIMGSSIIIGETTLLLDLFGIVTAVLPDMASTPVIETDDFETQPTVLLIEDSNFFLQHVKEFVEAAGYHTVTAQDGLEALEQLEQHGDDIDVVLTDIEMPNLDGLGLTERIRQDTRFAHLPVLALTSVAGDTAEKRGLAAGIDDYLIKLDKERVLDSVARHLTAKLAA